MKQLGPEAMAITKTFHDLGIFAKVEARIKAPSFILYGLKKQADERIAKIENAISEIELSVSEFRGAKTHVRFSTPPMMIEVPRPDAKAIRWPGTLENGPHEFTAGRSYQTGVAKTQIVNLDDSPHTLIAGITGSGKSVLEVGAVLSLALQTPPTDCRLALIDKKIRALVPLKELPHVDAFGHDDESIMRIISGAIAELERRKVSGELYPQRLVIVIDELAQLPPDALEMLNVLLALGRELNINIMSALQHPTAEIMGGASGKNNYTLRFVGRVSDATAAATASGRGKTGAEFLKKKTGAFLRIDDEITRMQSYLLNRADVERLVSQCVAKWGPRQAQPATVQAPAVEAVQADPLTDVFRQYHDGFGGLNRGGMAAAIRTAYGADAATSGRRYSEQRERVQDRFHEWL